MPSVLESISRWAARPVSIAASGPSAPAASGQRSSWNEALPGPPAAGHHRWAAGASSPHRGSGSRSDQAPSDGAASLRVPSPLCPPSPESGWGSRVCSVWSSALVSRPLLRCGPSRQPSLSPRTESTRFLSSCHLLTRFLLVYCSFLLSPPTRLSHEGRWARDSVWGKGK